MLGSKRSLFMNRSKKLREKGSNKKIENTHTRRERENHTRKGGQSPENIHIYRERIDKSMKDRPSIYL